MRSLVESLVSVQLKCLPAVVLMVSLPTLAGASSDLFLKALIDDQDIEPRHVELVDIDDDNDLDLVTGTERLIGGTTDDPVISWWRNDGTSNWVETTISSFSPGQQGSVGSLEVADLDGDGDADVVAGMMSSDSLYWWESSSDGAVWTQHFISLLDVFPAEIKAADVDGDSDLDLVHVGHQDPPGIGGLEAALIWWENSNGDASLWTRHVIESTGLGPFGIGGLSVGDLDDDGDNDIVATVFDFFGWWENTGNGATWTTHTITTPERPSTTAIVDIDGDNHLDIVGNDSGDGVFWWQNVDGTGLILTERQVDNGYGSYLATGDLDGDGDEDLVATDVDDLVWYANSGDGLSWTETVLGVGFDAEDIATGDMDGDGDIEITASLDGSLHEIAWWDNLSLNAPASFGAQTTIDNGLNRQLFAQALDVDDDGNVDVIGARGNRLYWVESDGTRHLVDNLPVTHAVGGDLDSDGDMDLVGAANSSHQVVWWENTSATGDGSTWARHTVATGVGGVFSVAVANLDGDGHPDILAAASDDDEVVWFENAGSGSGWTERIVTTGFDRAMTVGAADMDDDGDLDVIAGANHGDEVAWFENTAGTGLAWTDHTVDAMFDGASSVVASDVDCDGDLDLIGSAFDGNEVSWWQNTGGGLGWIKHFVATVTGATSIVAADFDRNGSPDLAVASLGGSEAIYLENTQGDGSSWAQTTVQSGFASVGVAAADMDNNGTIDLVSTTRSTVAWWSNDR